MRSVAVTDSGDARALHAVGERDALLRFLALCLRGAVLMPSGWRN